MSRQDCMSKLILLISLFTSLFTFASDLAGPEGTVINCIRKKSINFKPSTNTRNITIASYKGSLHSELKRCLRDSIKNDPNALAPALEKYLTQEKEMLDKHLASLEYKLFDQVNAGKRFKNCNKEIKALRPKKVFFHSSSELDKIFQNSLCPKYEAILRHKKSP